MVVAQLVERSPSTLEICGSNPVIGQTFIERLLIVNRVEKTKIMKKRPGMAIFFTKNVNGCIQKQISGHNPKEKS